MKRYIKLLMIILIVPFCKKATSQELINLYNIDPTDVGGILANAPEYFNPSANLVTWNSERVSGNAYNGEYVISLRDHFWFWRDMLPNFEHNDLSLFDQNDYLRTYSIELVSFPFSKDCAFNSADNCADLSTDRELYMPEFSSYNNLMNYWEYQGIGSTTYATNLYRKIDHGRFDNDGFSVGQNGNVEILVTAGFVYGLLFNHDRNVLPHSILKHTIAFHCGPDESDDIIASFSFYVDNTHGMMRYYPFASYNTPLNGTPKYYDIVIRPELLTGHEVYYYNGGNCDLFNEVSATSSCPFIGFNGGTIDYFPYNEINHSCLANNVQTDAESFTFGSAQWPIFYKVPFAPYSLPVSNFPRSNRGAQIAGFEIVNNNFININYPDPTSPYLPLQFNIDKKIDLSTINPHEMVIYNPSEVNISTTEADDLRFPSNYTFKTIRGAYPFASEVAADNTVENGGPYSDQRMVPVTTDVRASAGSGYSTADPKFASVYKLLNNSKLTIEPCVRLFDCTFDLQTGSELVFENWATNQVNVNRYGILLNGGKLNKTDDHFYFQNKNEDESILEYRSATTIEAGSYVDASNPQGPYTVLADADVTFIANDEVILSDGFTALAGSTFNASTANIFVSMCRPANAQRLFANQSDENVVSRPKLFSYSRILPNPTSQNTEIKFGITYSQFLSLKMYDSFGRELKIIIDHVKFEAGSYSQNIETSLLMPGVYYCKLLSGEAEEILKLIKIN